MFAPPSLAALAIFPNYDPKPNASARIAVLGKLPAAQTFGHVVHHGPGGGVRAATLREQDEPQRGQDRDEGFGLEHQREPTVKIATLIDHIEN